ncbi:MAG: hypothetical protein ABGY75_05500 [Gemmataceae bacterium]
MPDDLRYIVRRFNWQQPEPGRLVRLPGSAPVAEFLTEEEAENDRRQREQGVRAWVNPFHCGHRFDDLSYLPEFAFFDWLMDADIHPPKHDSTAKRPWASWWEQHNAGLTDDQRVRVWEGLGKVRFYEVEACGWGDRAYTVLQVMWQYNDNFYEPGSEGGEPMKAFRRLADAEAYRLLLEEQVRANYTGDEDRYTWYEMDRWREPLAPIPMDGQYPQIDTVPPARARFYEVVEVSLKSASG